jgi:hypothetical protein
MNYHTKTGPEHRYEGEVHVTGIRKDDQVCSKDQRRYNHPLVRSAAAWLYDYNHLPNELEDLPEEQMSMTAKIKKIKGLRMMGRLSELDNPQ